MTEKCRGLIVDTNGEVVARPFIKFFNFEDSTRPETQRSALPKESPVVTDKLDGSLGILYRYNGQVGVASKGSFTSEHAQWATKYYHDHYHNKIAWPSGWTPVFEMICQDVQTHVIRYGKESEGLYLLALIKNSTGEELGIHELETLGRDYRIPVVEHAYWHGLESSAHETLTTKNSSYEGYVLSWPRPGQTPLRVKMKTIPFLRLQRLLHHTRPKHILEALRDPAFRPQLDEWLSEQEAPQFVEFVKHWKDKLETSFKEIQAQVCLMYGTVMGELGAGATRKDYALRFKEHPYAPVLFAMLPAKDKQPEYGPIIWKMLEPLVHDLGPVSKEK